jgi:hypothetical protein
MRAGPGGRIRAPAGPHPKANPLLIARLCTIKSPMSVSARPFRANTFFCAAVGGKRSLGRLPRTHHGMLEARRIDVQPRQMVNAPLRD